MAMKNKLILLIAALALTCAGVAQAQQKPAAGKKPNILVIFGDDVGVTNISAYSDGLMGYETPNIDRIAKEGIRFLHYYAEQSCTAARRFGRIGMQTIKDTGALTKKRMETIDDETSAAAIDFMKRQVAAGKPFFTWMNTTRMHLRTHVRASHRGRYKHGDSEYVDGMLEHDDTIGPPLKARDGLGIPNKTAA